jgi:hypothetical protein
VRTHVILTKPQSRALQELSRASGMTVAEHIRRAIDDYLAMVNQQEKPR